MTSLGRWLAGILNAHIERHNVMAAELVDRPLAQRYMGRLDLDEAVTTAQRDSEIAEAMHAALGPPPTFRPCWVCSFEGGFSAPHHCDSHFDTTGGAARRPPAPAEIRLTVLSDIETRPASTWRRT